MRKTTIAVLVAVAAGAGGGWYAFRPDRAFIDATVSEVAPAAEALALREGRFMPRAHEGKGRAEIIRLGDGQLVLRFTEFETLNGPDLRVYLLGGTDVRDRSALKATGYLDLGALKGNIGDQNYVIPATTDVSRYRAVAVWCRRFGVNFTTAVLVNSPTPPPRG